MKSIEILAFSFLYFQQTFGLSFRDFLPIKHDIIKVRNESDIKWYLNRVVVLDFMGKVEKNKGYTAEEHNITTSDGYHLKLHRISGSPSSPKRHGKSVVFLMHGIVSSSDCWIQTGPAEDLAYLLADGGFDVWLGNSRGNTYSRSHEFLTPNSKRFWDFSFHEIGMIDLPAFIDYILKITNKNQLVYIGYSMGTTLSYVLLSKLPEYNKKISLVISLGSIAFWNRNHLPFVLRFGVNNYAAVQDFSEKNQFFEFMPQSSYLVNSAKVFCSNKNQLFKLKPCTKMLELWLPMLDVNNAEFSWVEFLKHSPAGSSMKLILHYIQNAAAEDFIEYDYGSKKNLEKYSKPNPPSYNLTRITAPIAVFYAPKDVFDPTGENLKKLKSNLPNLIYFEKVPRKSFNHMDFLLARDVKQILYDSLISLIRKNNCSGI